MTVIPDGWVETELGYVADSIQYGYTAKSSSEDIGPHFLRITDIQDGGVDWSTVPYCCINHRDIAKYGLITDDLVFARTGATVGKSFLIRGEIPESVFASYLIRVRLSTALAPQFTYYFFQSGDYWRQISESSSGIGQPNVNGTKLAALRLPLPPLAEQRRIVAKIEELFSELDAGEESLRRARRQLGVYRQSLLKQAFEGKLTAAWRAKYPETESASKLLKRILEQRRMQWNGKGKYKVPEDAAAERAGVIPDSWIWTATDSVCSQITDGEHIQPRYQNKGLPMLSAKHVRHGYVTLDDAGLIAPGDFQNCLKRCAPIKDDVLIVSVGATTGRTGIVGNQPPFALVRSVLLLRPLIIVPQYLMLWNHSSWCMRWKSGASGATAQPHLYISDTRRMPIPLCSLPEQREIVRLLDEQFTVIEQNEREIDAALKRSAALRQSILKKAFTGQLVPQDPTDEPASALLERIREERSAFNKNTCK